MSTTEKTHYRKAFDSPYLSSADLTEPTVLTVERVVLEPDKTKKTKDSFNTAYFAEKSIRPGEVLKPMILNATNSRIMRRFAGSHFIDDWKNIRVTLYVNDHVRFGKDTVEGLRISDEPPSNRRTLTPAQADVWARAKESFITTGNLNRVLANMDMSPEHQAQLQAEVLAERENTAPEPEHA